MFSISSKIFFQQLWLLIGTLCCIPINNSYTKAQIVPESILGENVSIQSENNTSRISGGVSSESNLFYSFLEFNVNLGESVYFIDPGVKNIIARVREKRSNIDGILGIQGGNANLFLINPMGIAFGRNAQLDLKGSFLASTADSIIFDDGSEFSLSSADSLSLLTVHIPIGLRFGNIPGSIENESTVTVIGSDGALISAGLTVPSEKTIALIGGNLSINGGYIYSPGSRVELGSVSDNSLVHLTPDLADWKLSYKDVESFQDINLFNGAVVQVGQDKGGDIHFQGRQINLLNSQVVAFSSGTTPGGNISIDAAESVLLEDFSELTTGNLDVANTSSGSISINTKSINIRDSIIDASSDSVGLPGDVTIKASDLLNVDNGAITASAVGGGKSGTIIIDVGELMLKNGAEVTVSSPNGGIAGSLEINSRYLLLDNQSRISASTTEGQVGNININSGNVILRENSSITTSAIESPAKTDGGNVSVVTDSLILENSDISANSTNSFGGRVNITAAGIFQSPDSTITATSAAGPQFNGIVNLNITNVDPTNSLSELPSYIVDPDALVAQNPCKRGSESEFTRSGRGGLPPNLSQDFNSDATQVGLVEPVRISASDRQQTKVSKGKTSSLASAALPIAPAQGWVFNDKGEVVLVSYNPAIAGPQRLKTNPAGCPVP
jgi:filamentous hemagglutinin family protein